MKTKLFKHISAAALAAILTVSGSTMVSSCTDLEETPYTFMDPSQYYKTETELQSALTTVYSAFRRMAGDYYYIMKLECCTDYGQPAYTKENCNLINAWVSVNDPSNSFKNTWSRAYMTINRANIVLGRGEAIEMDATAKNRIYAQARFLRAYSYFYLVRLFGGCPISETYTEGVTGLELPRKSVDEVYTQIITDLKWCEDNGQLPQKGDADYDNWRVTLGAVQALLGEVYLYRASMENDNQEYLKLAKDYSWKVIESQKYNLVKPYKDLWYWFNPNAKNNIESIFELQYAPISGQSTDMHRQFGFGELSDPAIGSYMYHRYSPAAYRYEEYADNDARKEVFVTDMVLSNGDILKYKPEDKGYYAKYKSFDGQRPDTTQWCTTGPGNAKYYDRQTDAAVQQPCTNFYILRYSEVLLNYAEAANKLKAGDGIEQLNEVRERAGLSKLSGLSQEALDDSIFIERGKEFIGEGKIYYDELRTDRLGKRVYEFVNRGVEEGYYFFQKLMFVPQKTFLWKIPQSDMDSNAALEQNPDNVTDPRYPL